MIRRPPRSTQSRSSAASDVYKRQVRPLFYTQKPGTKPGSHRSAIRSRWLCFTEDPKHLGPALLAGTLKCPPLVLHRDFLGAFHLPLCLALYAVRFCHCFPPLPWARVNSAFLTYPILIFAIEANIPLSDPRTFTFKIFWQILPGAPRLRNVILSPV